MSEKHEATYYIEQVLAEFGEPTRWEHLMPIVSRAAYHLGIERHLAYGHNNMSKRRPFLRVSAGSRGRQVTTIELGNGRPPLIVSAAEAEEMWQPGCIVRTLPEVREIPVAEKDVPFLETAGHEIIWREPSEEEALTAICDRANDKLQRLYRIIATGDEPDQEGFEDTAVDLLNYALYLVAFRRRTSEGQQWWQLPSVAHEYQERGLAFRPEELRFLLPKHHNYRPGGDKPAEGGSYV